jgi:hypothetical protein
VRARAISRAYCPLPQIKFHPLAGGIDGRVIELDFKRELVAVVRVKPCPLQVGSLALAHFHGLGDADEPARRILIHHAALCNRYTNEAAEPSKMGTLRQ